MKMRRSIVAGALAMPMLALLVLSTVHTVSLERRLAKLEASHERLLQFTHDFGTNLLREARLRGTFSDDMVLRTVMLAHEQRTTSVSILSQVHRNGMPAALP